MEVCSLTGDGHQTIPPLPQVPTGALAVAVVGVKEKVGVEHGWLSQHPHRRVGGQWAFDDGGLGDEWPLESIQQCLEETGDWWRFMNSPCHEEIRRASDSEPSWNWGDHN